MPFFWWWWWPPPWWLNVVLTSTKTLISRGVTTVLRYSAVASFYLFPSTKSLALASNPRKSTYLGGSICSLNSSPETPPELSLLTTYVLLHSFLLPLRYTYSSFFFKTNFNITSSRNSALLNNTIITSASTFLASTFQTQVTQPEHFTFHLNCYFILFFSS